MRGDLRVVELRARCARGSGARGGSASGNAGGAPSLVAGTNASISSITRSNDGSPGRRDVAARLERHEPRAGIDEAMKSPSSNGAHMSPRVWRTSVGQATCGRYAEASMSLKLATRRAACSRRARHALQIVERADLLGRGVREDQVGEELEERRVVLPPADLDQLDLRLAGSRAPRASGCGAAARARTPRAARGGARARGAGRRRRSRRRRPARCRAARTARASRRRRPPRGPRRGRRATRRSRSRSDRPQPRES